MGVQARQLPRIKVCCIASEQEAWMAIDAGTDALGLVTAMPSGAGVITDDVAASIALMTPPGVDTFLLTCRRDAYSVVEQHRSIRTTTIQLVARVELRELARIRDALPGVRLVQVIHVQGEVSLRMAQSVVGHVDAVLLDSGHPTATTKELGGTGRRHDWSISRRIRETLNIPVFLAGGLTPGNVGQAVREVGPYGIDVCSGLRVDGSLDGHLLIEFFRSARHFSGPSDPV